MQELRPAFLAAAEAAGDAHQGSVCSSASEQAGGERLRAVASACEVSCLESKNLLGGMGGMLESPASVSSPDDPSTAFLPFCFSSGKLLGSLVLVTPVELVGTANGT